MTEVEIKKQSSWLKWTKWAGIILVLLAVVLPLLADRARAWSMYNSRERITEVHNQIDDQYLKGRTPLEWHLQRQSGDNGWEHMLPFIEIDMRAGRWERENNWDEGDKVPDFVRQSEVYNQIGKWNNEADDEPDTAKYIEWIGATQDMADAISKAANSEYVLRLSYGDEPYPALDGYVFTGGSFWSVMYARCELQFEVGRYDDAWFDMTQLLGFVNKQKHPAALIDMIIIYGTRKKIQEELLEQIYAEHLPTNMPDLSYFEPIDIEKLVLEGAKGELMWTYAGTQAAIYPVTEPEYFDWAFNSIPEGRGFFALDSLSHSAYEKYVGSINISGMLATTLESSLQYVDWAKKGSWNLSDAPEEINSVIGINAESLISQRAYIANSELHTVELALRIMEHNNGPLLDQRDEVDRYIAKFPHVLSTWNNEAIDIYLAEDWENEESEIITIEPIAVKLLEIALAEEAEE